MADVPLPGRAGERELTAGRGARRERSFPLPLPLPPTVAAVLTTLDGAGHEAALVGGCVRDVLLGQRPGDWDVATAAPPERVAALFPGATWENPFGTVTVRGEQDVEVTTYRSEGPYRDRRRPAHVAWGERLEDDLQRRDFTINAIAWRPQLPLDAAQPAGILVDPHDGAADLAAGLLRAVGDPDRRLEEDALRLVRAVRFATRFDLAIEAGTAAAIRRHAASAASLSGERVRDELLRILAAPGPPSRAMRLMDELGLLGVLLPELVALRGVPQGKPLPGDALEHSLRTADALAPADPLLRLVGLLHDVGKATTFARGHFIGHEEVGAEMVAGVMRRLRFPARDIARAVHLVRHHMFAYAPEWTDAAVRRFIRRVGSGALADLFALREADNRASGVAEAGAGELAELRSRIDALAGHPLAARELAVDGHDLQAALGLAPGPELGWLLEQLLEAVVERPELNEREALLALARRLRAGRS